MNNQTELYALIERMQHSDQAALGRFYDLTVSYVFGLAMRITSKPSLAEEVVNDVYLQAWRNRANYQASQAAPLAWLMMMTHSRAIDALRREATATQQQLPIADDFDAVDEHSLNQLEQLTQLEQTEQLAAALKLLNTQQRQWIMLAFYRGMSHQDIADYTGEPLGTVKTVLRRAQAILRTALTTTYPHGGIYE
ncbi:RNA polymerase sigma-70 factor, ECF subfamily [Thiothrix eikelboomii]|uniref:RNA polymerase sigma-70 factor, ECF subfamily n=1 Tax=Thiothrix eikelboomii TaxID=92487 RepID=A0A1T4XNI6_9GAMM|nr:sigma-70 family RNA polymerase sigma factor [Thiothrix eikelboomii]SKA91109.1 RNA polymerase sigma-70 factor, ECF subfamily [Thiothrix eikelboomii]